MRCWWTRTLASQDVECTFYHGLKYCRKLSLWNNGVFYQKIIQYFQFRPISFPGPNLQIGGGQICRIAELQNCRIPECSMIKGRQLLCLSRYSGNGSDCVLCPAGKASSLGCDIVRDARAIAGDVAAECFAGREACRNCKANQYSSPGGLCLPCLEGKYSRPGSSNCTSCPRGKFSILINTCSSKHNHVFM